MRHFGQSLAVILASLTAFPAAATPPDALINNALSLPAELNKTIIVDEEVTQLRTWHWMGCICQNWVSML